MNQLVAVDTVLTADSVEWCPVPGLEGVLACGTYQLNQHESSSTRLGSLLLFHWDGNKWVGLAGCFADCILSCKCLICCRLARILENITTKYSFGILDMKWLVKEIIEHPLQSVCRLGSHVPRI